MPRPQKNPQASTDSEFHLLLWLATCVSVLSFLFFYRNGQVLLYGDAIAHINIARRVFDSKTPGLLQLGTVWLPLPHLLMIPFLLSTEMWQRGAGGSIPSMAGYVFAIAGIFRLTRTVVSRTAEPDAVSRVCAWFAAVVFAANPNLLYMQSTAMGETLYLAFFVWTLAYFAESSRDQHALTKSALCLAAACLTRYDGWFLAAAMVLTVLVAYVAQRRSSTEMSAGLKSSTITKFILIAAAAPALWLAYNGIVYRNALEFENGPYSAKAIERRSQTPGNLGHPGSANPILAARYFLKSAEDNVAQNQWLQRTWLILALAAIIASWKLSLTKFQKIALLLLLIPLPFYGISIAYGGVPIFIPNWWPFSHYNARYGLQLLPTFAVVIAMLTALALRSSSFNKRLRLASLLALAAFVAASYISIWRATPICLQEAQINMRSRNQLQLEIARWIEKLPPDSTLLMYLGDHVGALERVAFPLRRTINEGNHRVWKQPSDSEGLWERALADPAKYADFVLAFDGDPVWQSVRDKHLHALVELHVTGQPNAVLYSAR